MWIVLGGYHVVEGKREELLRQIKEQKIIDRIREEKGNIGYDYYLDLNGQDIFFVEKWECFEDWQAHTQAPHVTGELKALKDLYVLNLIPGYLGDFTQKAI